MISVFEFGGAELIGFRFSCIIPFGGSALINHRELRLKILYGIVYDFI